MLFSLRGRLSLAMFWILGAAVNSVFFLSSAYVASMIASNSILVATIGIVVSESFVWVCLALLAKRFHDIGWPGWFAIAVFFPAGQAFLTVTAGIGRGTHGPNRYGMDPRSIWFPGIVDPPVR
ncbi:MAG: DUF805 domain-containing protein [Planctomycetota bacterium]